MKLRKILSTAVAVLMLVALIPAASLAESVGSFVKETKGLNRMDKVWEAIDAVEAEAIADGLDRSKVINAVYSAALSLDDVDADSFSGFDADGFFFTVDGLYNTYDYKLRNEIDKSGVLSDQGKIVIKNDAKVKDAEARDVLVVGPYYGLDASFTNGYKKEAASIAAVTGGEAVILEGHAATGPEIVKNYIDKAVVIYDSHGVQDGTTTYLCLTSRDGITTQDYSMRWAVNGGNYYGIDGRYIENHLDGKKLANTFVWMAICEGMHRSGNGTTGKALLNSGAGVVYGYSQSVTFYYDYIYEATFWSEMKNGKTVAEAYNKMIAAHGESDPYSNPRAYPVVMSDVDPFPSNPDSKQTVNCQWTLLGGLKPIDLTSYSLSTTNIDMMVAESETVDFIPEPANATHYELLWTSSNDTVASVTGNKHNAKIMGLSAGTAVITCAITVDGKVEHEEKITVNIKNDPELEAALNVEGGTLSFSTSSEYGFKVTTSDDRNCVVSDNVGIKSSAAVLSTTVKMAAGDTLSFDYWYGIEKSFDWFIFNVNGSRLKKWSGTDDIKWDTYTYTATEAGTYTFEWRYEKDGGGNADPDCVMLDNVEYKSNGGVVPSDNPTATPNPTGTPTPTPTPTDAPTPIPTGDQTPTPTSEPITANGDLDGDGEITVTDAILSLRGAMGLITLSDAQKAAADMDGDGAITTVDAVSILRKAVLTNA